MAVNITGGTIFLARLLTGEADFPGKWIIFEARKEKTRLRLMKYDFIIVIVSYRFFLVIK